ncbi:MAG: hypothetical protein Q7R49_05795 [Candidatus Daviesbacteria bacterium]|nr:hypothetical protein [Candidatus Daviesbacteria bacterium]
MRTKIFILIILLVIILIPLSAWVYVNLNKPQPAEPANEQLSRDQSYRCPVEKNVCKAAEQFTLPHKPIAFNALGYRNLASGSAVLAMIDGRYGVGASVDKNGGKTTILTITNDSLNLTVEYQFKGQNYTPLGTGKDIVKAGEVIARLSNEKITTAENQLYSLMVSVQNIKTKEYIRLSPQELKYGIISL